MQTHCSSNQLVFQAFHGRSVIGSFDGGQITSDAGGLLLREIEQGQQFLKRFSQCFLDLRDPRFVEHSVYQLVSQRVYGLCLGNEDLNDHDQLRADPLLALLCGKSDLEGKARRNVRDRGKALAGKSTLNRLETAGSFFSKRPRYKKILAETTELEEFFVHSFLRTTKKAPRLLVLDFDATDDPLHGKQEGRFFHGYYDCYCYLPLYVFCGDQLLWSQLRKADIDASDGALEVAQRIVKMIRHKWPLVQILIRADSGFCRDSLMSWCETNGSELPLRIGQKQASFEAYLPHDEKDTAGLGLLGSRGPTLHSILAIAHDSSWSRGRRVVAKAEYLDKGENPRFVVTNLSAQEYEAQELYEKLYCARGEMENRIKEQQLYLFADRTSSATMSGQPTAPMVLLAGLRDSQRASQCRTSRQRAWPRQPVQAFG